ncbi:hypothetical protein BYT27DRAFT_7183640 [Phlegmacium glaucopus]|nr:hypothetical protein BYT27DRAFT_7183640 [Phlegmacium glaucopus]
MEAQGVYKDPIVSDLPFVGCASKKVQGWNGVLMDEERVIGIIVEANGHLGAIEIHHFPGTRN